jgi:hypothetical protein
MTTIWERTNSALTPLGVTMAEGILLMPSGQELPDLFLTYILVDDVPNQFADNKEQAKASRVQVSCFCRNGLINLPDITGAMISVGFIRSNTTEIPYNQETRHFGLALEFVYQE